MKRLILGLMVILLLLTLEIQAYSDSNSDSKPKPDFLRVFDTIDAEFPDDIILDSQENIIVAVYYRGWVEILGPRILVLDHKGNLKDYFRVAYSQYLKEELRLVKIFLQQDGYLIIGTLDETRSGGCTLPN